MDGDLEELLGLGRLLDVAPGKLGGETAGVFLAGDAVEGADAYGGVRTAPAKSCAEEFERRRGRANIVLKARQMGISTWVAGRFFLKTVTQPGTLSVQVAHTQEAAEEIFRVVRRFHSELPEELREGVLADIAGECAVAGVSGVGQRVPRGDRGRSECGTRADGAEPALL